MTAIEEAKTAATKLSPAERKTFWEWLSTDAVELSPGIHSTPGVCGGKACAGRSRITVRLLESYRRSGLSDSELLKAYPQLTPEDFVHAWAYADARPQEMDRLIRENESAEAE